MLHNQRMLFVHCADCLGEVVAGSSQGVGVAAGWAQVRGLRSCACVDGETASLLGSVGLEKRLLGFIGLGLLELLGGLALGAGGFLTA
jgi:hypothetical protein